MRRRMVVQGLVGVMTLVVGYGMGWGVANHRSTTRIDRVVAMQWGDGKYGPGFYGAHVYLEPVPGGYAVRAQVHVGRGNGYVHDCGELGRVTTDAEAVSTWGSIRWADEGLHIGQGSRGYFLPRAELDAHR